MNEWNPLVVKGDYMIELLKYASLDTLRMIRKDFGEPTFPTAGVIKLIEDEINKKESAIIGNFDTISEEPDFSDF